MKTHRVRSGTIPHAVLQLALATVVIVLLAQTATAQEVAAQEGPALVEELEDRLMYELARTWIQLVEGIADDPQFLESPAGQHLLMQSEALQMIYHQMRETLGPETVRHEPQEPGRFQFVDWLDPGLRYRVFDTRTGEIQIREALPRPE